MATGKLPFRGDTAGALSNEILNRTAASPEQLNPEVPGELAGTSGSAWKRTESSDTSPQETFGRTSNGCAATARPESLRRPPRLAAGLPDAVRVCPGSEGWLWSSPWRLCGFSGRGVVAPVEPMSILPFTTDGGLKYAPRLSPEGDRVVYSWAGPDDDNWDIYVKAVGPGDEEPCD